MPDMFLRDEISLGYKEVYRRPRHKAAEPDKSNSLALTSCNANYTNIPSGQMLPMLHRGSVAVECSP